MLDRLLDFLKELPGGSLLAGGAVPERDETLRLDDPKLAAAALLYHMMAVDGVAHASERNRFSELISQKYGLKGDKLKRLLSAAQDADQEAVDITAFTTVLQRKLDYSSRVELAELMWAVVYADGDAGEVESDAMWRAVDLMGIKESDHQLIQQKAEQTLEQLSNR